MDAAEQYPCAARIDSQSLTGQSDLFTAPALWEGDMVTLLAGQFHNLAQFFEGQVLGGLVKCIDEFSRWGIAAARLERIMDG
jgi:hypothetical protein